MKNTLFVCLGIILLCSFSYFLGIRQTKPNVCFTFHTDDKLRVGIANRISIFAEQEEPIKLEQISISSQLIIDPETIEGDAGATIEGDSSEFIVRVNNSSIIDIAVKTNKGTATQRFDAIPVTAVPKFGIMHGGSTSVDKFKATKGMIAWVECCDFDARCEMLDYSIIRITKKKSS